RCCNTPQGLVSRASPLALIHSRSRTTRPAVGRRSRSAVLHFASAAGAAGHQTSSTPVGCPNGSPPATSLMIGKGPVKAVTTTPCEHSPDAGDGQLLPRRNWARCPRRESNPHLCRF